MGEKIVKGGRHFIIAGKSALITASAALLFSFTACAAAAGQHEDRWDNELSEFGRLESKLYGTVEDMPKDQIGSWTVNGREVVVTRDTVIRDRHGKADRGAYVKVEGAVSGSKFLAREIEVKKSKRGGRR